MDVRETAKKIVGSILEDIQDRRGLRQEWEQIDSDIRREIIEKWEEMTANHLSDEGSAAT